MKILLGRRRCSAAVNSLSPWCASLKSNISGGGLRVNKYTLQSAEPRIMSVQSQKVIM